MTRWRDAAHATLEAARANDGGSGLRGAIGDALFACAVSDSGAAHEWIQRAIDDLEANGTEVSLHRGITGLGLVIAMYLPAEEELLAYVDDVALDRLESLPPASVQSGVAGVALYASMRSGAESGRLLQSAVVERLRVTATAGDGGVVWTTPMAYAKSRGMDVPGEPVLELGMVHGVAGTLVGLAALAAQGSAEAADLARAGVAAAWSHAKDGANRFGRVSFGAGGSRGAKEWDVPRWCVGDPGVLRSLWLVSRTIGDAASAERALAALESDAASEVREPRDRLEGRLDLCCGASATAQVYSRMHRETGKGVFRDANAALLARCAEGYMRMGDTSLPYGTMGALLALMAGEDDDDPSWDAMLGMSLPRQVAR